MRFPQLFPIPILREETMLMSLKKALGAMALFGWAGLVLATDNQGSSQGSGSGSLPPTISPPVVVAPTFVEERSVIDRENGVSDPGLQAGVAWHLLRPVINNNFAFATINTPPGGGFTNNNTNFRYDYDSAVSL